MIFGIRRGTFTDLLCIEINPFEAGHRKWYNLTSISM